MFKIEIVTNSKSSELYEALRKAIHDTLADYRINHEVHPDITTTSSFNPHK